MREGVSQSLILFQSWDQRERLRSRVVGRNINSKSGAEKLLIRIGSIQGGLIDINKSKKRIYYSSYSIVDWM